VIVAASTACFRDLPLPDVYEKLIELEYSGVEVDIDESGIQLKPSEVTESLDKSVAVCRDIHRLDMVAYRVSPARGPTYYEDFRSCCRLAKATKVSSITVPSSELGTPFNEEVERLRKLVDLANEEAIVVSIKSEIGCLSEDPDTVVVLCDNVKGLGVALDPSHYVCGPHRKRGFDHLISYTYNVYLRDTNETELQVRVGQGEIDYGKLVNQLNREKYDRALTVEMTEQSDVDHSAEMRKLRLLLESWL
jgi:sugar phosphate isomerase/epimerase